MVRKKIPYNVEKILFSRVAALCIVRTCLRIAQCFPETWGVNKKLSRAHREVDQALCVEHTQNYGIQIISQDCK